MKAHLIASVSSGVSIFAAIGWDRLTLGIGVLIAITALTFADKISAEAAIGIYSAIAGYVVGAGHESVRKGEKVP